MAFEKTHGGGDYHPTLSCSRVNVKLHAGDSNKVYGDSTPRHLANISSSRHVEML